MHDDAYDIGGDAQARKMADVLLFARMAKVIAKGNHAPRQHLWLTFIAVIYYYSVRLFGRFFFNYTSSK